MTYDPSKSDYFICLDEAPIKGHRTPKYDLMCGDADEAIGCHIADATTIKALVAKVPAGETVWRTYLQRTDGKTGKKEIKRKEK